MGITGRFVQLGAQCWGMGRSTAIVASANRSPPRSGQRGDKFMTPDRNRNDSSRDDIHRNDIRRSIRIVLGLASSFAALTAVGQESATTPVEEVVVTGFRGSLEAALDDKKLSASAIDSIRAEDIAKFP